MTGTLTDEDLDRLEAAYVAATPGEWRYRPDRYDDWGYVLNTARQVVLIGRAGGDADHDAHRRAGTDPMAPNALFAVAAHESFPALIAAVW